MADNFTITANLSTTPKAVYDAWLSTDGHTGMTGSPAKVDGKVGGDFTAWDGYISGTFLELEKDRKIVQSWRTSEFPEEAEDSRVEVILEASGKGTKIMLIHSDIPEGQEEEYKQGWEDFYFKPMKVYFG
jgi:activator of HSP90 ATPase